MRCAGLGTVSVLGQAAGLGVRVGQVAGGVADIKDGHSDTVYGICFSPDAKMIVTGSADKLVKIFEVPSGKFVNQFSGHKHHVLAVGWEASGQLLASAGADKTIKIWQWQDERLIRTIKAHDKEITRLQFVGDSMLLMTCSGDGTLNLLSAANGSHIRTFPGGKDFLYALAISSDGSRVAAGGQEGIARIYDGKSAQLHFSILPTGKRENRAKN